MIIPASIFNALCGKASVDPNESHPWINFRSHAVVSVDETHAAFPLAVTRVVAPHAPASPCKAGAALKQLLARFGISADEPGCQCKSRAALMDRQGCEWVEANVDTVVGWLREEAHKRGLPFIDAAGKMLVREALRRARKDAAARARGPQRQD